MRDFTPVERRMRDEHDAYETTFHGRRHATTPLLDDSPPWWNALLLPPLVVVLSVSLVALTLWDWLRKLLR